ncbi:hypothetical protein B0H16DRAFT_1693172 [Mycena metata]|uniref:Uncharacterized protein n=1 Tax=Mycena metata TaxID=1033252 RepID=A0AAD7ILS8_9AGAR|nr:hypothetical protein B0H16DRAFT_1693172 [Mycena metata]
MDLKMEGIEGKRKGKPQCIRAHFIISVISEMGERTSFDKIIMSAGLKKLGVNAWKARKNEGVPIDHPGTPENDQDNKYTDVWVPMEEEGIRFLPVSGANAALERRERDYNFWASFDVGITNNATQPAITGPGRIGLMNNECKDKHQTRPSLRSTMFSRRLLVELCLSFHFQSNLGSRIGRLTLARGMKERSRRSAAPLADVVSFRTCEDWGFNSYSIQQPESPPLYFPSSPFWSWTISWTSEGRNRRRFGFTRSMDNLAPSLKPVIKFI